MRLGRWLASLVLAVLALGPDPGRAAAPAAPPAEGAAPPPSASADAPVDLDALLAKVQARYAKAAGVHARFRQETTLVTVGQDVAAGGEAWFAKPGKMRWEYDRPDPQTLVSDGATFWLHQPLRNQVTVSPVPPEIAARVPTAFFTGTGDLTQDYDATLVSAEDAIAAPVVVDLAPKAKEGASGPAPFRKLRVSITKGTSLVEELEIHDPFGNVNRLSFDLVELLDRIDPARFTFEIPPEAQVVRPQPPHVPSELPPGATP